MAGQNKWGTGYYPMPHNILSEFFFIRIIDVTSATPIGWIYSLVSTTISSRSEAPRAWFSASWYSGLW